MVSPSRLGAVRGLLLALGSFMEVACLVHLGHRFTMQTFYTSFGALLISILPLLRRAEIGMTLCQLSLPL